jgi:hypothetical protein
MKRQFWEGNCYLLCVCSVPGQIVPAVLHFLCHRTTLWKKGTVSVLQLRKLELREAVSLPRSKPVAVSAQLKAWAPQLLFASVFSVQIHFLRASNGSLVNHICSLLLLKITLVTKDFQGLIGFRERRVPYPFWEVFSFCDVRDQIQGLLNVGKGYTTEVYPPHPVSYFPFKS